MLKNEQTLQELFDAIRKGIISIMGIPEEKSGKREQRV